ncbi:MAG: TfoX/Sxy family protein [Alphaproteobacteria bacterium]|nr:TfoX/Sxy family protein [Alphaproteobacteria bacterium]
MAWRKSPPALIAAFDAALPDDASVERRKMFGYPAAFAHGHLFTGLHQESLMVRLGEAQRAALVKSGGRPFEPMPGRTMREYVVVPDDIVANRRALATWLKRGLAHVASLPPKATRRKSRSKDSG